MKQRTAIVIGSLLFAAGCFTSLWLVIATLEAGIKGVFSNIVTDAPSQPFTSLRCPLLMGSAEASQVDASITNPTSDAIEYSVQITASGLTVDVSNSAQILTVPGHQTSQLAWQVVAQTPGNQVVVVQAISANDLALPGPFHTWPTSFRESCGVLIVDTPLTGAQLVGFCGLCLVAGSMLVLPALFRTLRRIRTPDNIGVA